jgi:hypothetical protein
MEDGRLLKLDNKYAGRRGFVIGGGPSIKDYSKESIERLSKEVTIGANHAFLLFTPTFLCLIDKGYWRDFHQELKKLHCPILCPDKLTFIQSRNVYKFLTGRKNRDSLAPKSFTERVPFYNNAGATALRIAYIIGCDPIYLVGIDMYKPDKLAGITHFHDAYDPKRKDGTQASRYDAFETCFVKTIEAMGDRKIYSCSPKCHVLNEKVIPFVSLEKVLNNDQKNLA